MLATTINMHVEVYSAITRCARVLGISRRDLVVRLLMTVMREVRHYRKEFCTVRYQPDDMREKWHCFSIKFRPDENEFFVDLRKVCKFSVSFLVAIAARKYLEGMLKEGNGGRYNKVRFNNYTIQHDTAHGVMCWHISWGLPLRE